MLATCTVDTFRPLVGTTFTVTATDASGTAHAVPLTLVEATEASAGNGGRAPFSLLFRGPARLHLHQATHPVAHETLGAFDLFLVPVALSEDAAEYEAVFG